jgi:hypothetical protein
VNSLHEIQSISRQHVALAWRQNDAVGAFARQADSLSNSIDSATIFPVTWLAAGMHHRCNLDFISLNSEDQHVRKYLEATSSQVSSETAVDFWIHPNTILS